MKKFVYALVIVIVAASLLFLLRKKPATPATESNTNTQQSRTDIDSLKFSNTMVWDPSLLTAAHQPLKYFTNWQSQINLQPPPENTSTQTQTEINTLLSYKTLRTPEKIQEIKDQADAYGAVIGSHTLLDYLDTKKFPHTAEFLKETFNDLNIIILSEKEKFDRVRPSLLEPGLNPVLLVPGHPAYPSGHSTQFHYIAYVLGALMPDKKESLIAEADSIAKNREIAGLHYPSDTQAGISLATQYFNLILKDPKFQAMLNAAKAEWR